MMRRVAWSSIPSPSFQAAHIDRIITPARRNNERDHITGMLLFTGIHFLAHLEGDEHDLTELWARLERDTGHCRLFRIGDESCSARRYPAWMRAYLVDPRVDAQIVALRLVPARLERKFNRRGESAASSAALPSRTTAGWGQTIFPIMSRADGM